jgi:hypothetical protein
MLYICTYGTYHQSLSISESLVDYYEYRSERWIAVGIIITVIDVYLFWGEANKTLCCVVVGGWSAVVVSDPRSAADFSFYTM